MFTIKSGGTIYNSVNFNVDWKVDGTVNAEAGFGGAIAQAQLWIFPFGPLPTPGPQFFATYYYAETHTPTNTFQTLLGDTNADGTVRTQPGNSYWIYGRLEVSATRLTDTPIEWNIDGTSEANFLDTVTLSIAPAATTPDVTFTTDSGFDHAPVPEASSFAAATLGIASLLTTRRRPSAGTRKRWTRKR
jgi:hypothetical protein